MKLFHGLYLILLGCLLSTSLAHAGLKLELIGVHHSGVYGQSAAEISAFDSATQKLFVVNANVGEIEIFDLHDPAHPVPLGSLKAEPYAALIHSVAVRNGVLAAAAEPKPKTDPGCVIFFDIQGNYLHHVTVGALPDMLAFTPDGRSVLVCNEGEPVSDYSVDPEGSISIVDISGGVRNAVVSTAAFTRFNGREDSLRSQGVLIYGPNASASQDFEPEYLTISSDSKTAWVTLQENNALAIVDIPSATVTSVVSLGFKDHSLPGNGLDASDEDNGIHINTWPVLGLYSPDAISSYEVNGETFLVLANEGDSRDYEGFSESIRLRKAPPLDSAAFSNASDLLKEKALGRLIVSRMLGDTDRDGDLDAIYSYGGRSFSIRDASGKLVFDSGDQFEQKLAELFPEEFNSDDEANQSFDSRGDNKGPEPEDVNLGVIDGRTYAFIGLERMGGVMVYDITDPHAPNFVTYKTSRNFDAVLPNTPALNDLEKIVELGPEGVEFIPASESPNHSPLLIVCNEISGSVTIYRIDTN